ncbi:uncharacterized protein DEA37_0002325 [Paragonimus westermani]|uniref:DUF1279 domain-containing protein n=1 Tax=Paragonimus westermani TaxID=34504 RepID=A0A5J4NFA5_9TREM|nr:uncharacterized protein DEA37_0002325 [Paragonimus westermani]
MRIKFSDHHMFLCQRILPVATTRSALLVSTVIRGTSSHGLLRLQNMFHRERLLTGFPQTTFPFMRTLHLTHPLVSSTKRLFSTVEDDEERNIDARKSSLIQRFKESYAIYGKVVLVIHGLTSCVWFASAFAVASCGINLLDLFEAANFPNWICQPLRMGGGTVNTLATSLVLYKLVAPFRYGLTLVLTRYVVRYLRAKGKAPPVTDQNRLRSLARESAQLSRERLKARISKERKRALAMSKKAKRSFMDKYRN